MNASLYPGIHFYTRNPKGIIKRYKRQARQEYARVEVGLQQLRDRIALLETLEGRGAKDLLRELRHQYSFYAKGRKTDVIQLLAPNCLSTYTYIAPDTDMRELVCDLSKKYQCPVLVTYYQFFNNNVIIAAAKDGILSAYGNQQEGNKIEGIEWLFTQAGIPFQRPISLKDGRFVAWFEHTFGVQ
ncbi:MAG: hypothetical protein RR361_08100, partial [Anaerovorax sp.]